jgi:hypothetical protein
MKKEWRHPFWETAAKDRITCRLNITHDDNSFSTSVARVSKYDQDGKVTQDYNEIIEQNTIEAIDKFTKERLKRHNQERESNLKREKEKHEAKRLEDLFNYKLQTFEIPEIKESSNRKLKSKIRKAKNLVEMNAYATILLMENMSAATAESQ